VKSFRGEQVHDGVAFMDASARSVFIAKVYNLLFAVIALMVAAGFVAFKKVELPISTGLFYTLLIAPLGVLLIGSFTKKIKGVNLVLFAVYGILEGLFLGVLAKAYSEAGLGTILCPGCHFVPAGLRRPHGVRARDQKGFLVFGRNSFVLLFVLLGPALWDSL
jgi:FtsH-binding integral membrane protein